MASLVLLVQQDQLELMESRETRVTLDCQVCPVLPAHWELKAALESELRVQRESLE